MKKILTVTLPVLVLVPKAVSAHCPLCTAGAGALAVLAASLGISSVIVGILIGAFALALGLWLAPLVKKQYVPLQKLMLVLLVFLTTVVPIMPLVREYAPLYIAWWGDYGTLLHNTYTVNLFILGVALGAAVMFVSPFVSRGMTKLRGSSLPYQGLLITFTLLILTSLTVQFLS